MGEVIVGYKKCFVPNKSG